MRAYRIRGGTVKASCERRALERRAVASRLVRRLSSGLGRLAPLAISVVPCPLIRDRRGASGREASLRQHSPEIDNHLGVDILTARRMEHLRFRAERNLELAVALVRHRSNRLEQRHDLAPLDVPTCWMAEDLFDRVVMMATQMGVYREPSIGLPVVSATHDPTAALAVARTAVAPGADALRSWYDHHRLPGLWSAQPRQADRFRVPSLPDLQIGTSLAGRCRRGDVCRGNERLGAGGG